MKNCKNRKLNFRTEAEIKEEAEKMLEEDYADFLKKIDPSYISAKAAEDIKRMRDYLDKCDAALIASHEKKRMDEDKNKATELKCSLDFKTDGCPCGSLWIATRMINGIKKLVNKIKERRRKRKDGK